MEATPFTESQKELRKLCSSRVQSIDVRIMNAGEMTASSNPRKKRIAKKPAKLKTAAYIRIEISVLHVDKMYLTCGFTHLKHTNSPPYE
jgi:hypothetical protein